MKIVFDSDYVYTFAASSKILIPNYIQRHTVYNTRNRQIFIIEHHHYDALWENFFSKVQTLGARTVAGIDGLVY